MDRPGIGRIRDFFPIVLLFVAFNCEVKVGVSLQRRSFWDRRRVKKWERLEFCDCFCIWFLRLVVQVWEEGGGFSFHNGPLFSSPSVAFYGRS